MSQFFKNPKGFTLIEILIGIAIIGILSAVAIPQYNKYKIRGYDAHSKQALRDMHTLCNAYWLDNDSSDECELSLIKSITYGFNQNPEIVATLPPSPLDNFCGAAKHNSSPNTYSIDSVAMISDNEDCGTGKAAERAAQAEAERIAAEELAKADAEARMCADIAFYDQKKGGEINGKFYKGYISNKYPNAGFAQYQTRGELAYLQRGGSQQILDFWRSCRGRAADTVGEFHKKHYSDYRKRMSNGWAPLTPEDLNSAGYFNFHVRAIVSTECLNDQRQCMSIKSRTSPDKNRSSESRAIFQERLVISGCDRLLQSSCSIEPKGDRFNAPGETCNMAGGRAHDCSIIADLIPSCKGQTGYTLPGCKGFRSDEEAMIKSCSSNWSHRADREQQFRQYWKDRIYPNGRDKFIFDKPANESMCIRLAFNDPKTLRYIQDELDYSP